MSSLQDFLKKIWHNVISGWNYALDVLNGQSEPEEPEEEQSAERNEGDLSQEAMAETDENAVVAEKEQQKEHHLMFAKHTSRLFTDKPINCFFAVDVETTGLSCVVDRIIEISAVKFENGVETASFSTLVASVDHVPQKAFEINGITDQELKENGISEQEAIDQFFAFLGDDVLDGKICLVAHNADFDMGFIYWMFDRTKQKSNAYIWYMDTLDLSRSFLSLERNRLSDIAAHFGIENYNAHRADSDARVCGQIFIRLYPKLVAQYQRLNAKDKNTISDQNVPSAEEKEAAALIVKILRDAGKDVSALTFEKYVSKIYIDCNLNDRFAYFKIKQKQGLMIAFNEFDLPGFAVTVNKQDVFSAHVSLQQPSELFLLKDAIIDAFEQTVSRHFEYYENIGDFRKSPKMFQIAIEDIEPLVLSAKKKEIERENIKLEKEKAEIERKQRALEREIQKAERNAMPPKEPVNVCKPIAKCDEDGNIIESYESVSAASSATGIDPKSIRDAAKGRQKHAGKYRWKYI